MLLNQKCFAYQRWVHHVLRKREEKVSRTWISKAGIDFFNGKFFLIYFPIPADNIKKISVYKSSIPRSFILFVLLVDHMYLF